MGINHSMNHAQIETVITQFDATTASIKGIEAKAQRVRSHMAEAKLQRDTLTKYAEVGNTLCRSLGTSMSLMSDDMFEYFALSVDKFAYLVENLERTVLDFNLFNAPRELQKELGPVIVPAIVLVFIVTCSNLVFGFILASDLKLGLGIEPFSLSVSPAGEPSDDGTDDTFHFLFFFAIFHAFLIFAAAVYIVGEFGRRVIKKRRRKREKEKRRHLRQLEQLKQERLKQSEDQLVDEHVQSSRDSEAAFGSPSGMRDRRSRLSQEAPISSLLRTIQRTTVNLNEKRKANILSPTRAARMSVDESSPCGRTPVASPAYHEGGLERHAWTTEHT